IGQRAFFRNADINQKGDRQRPVSFPLKSEERLRHAVLDHPDIALLQGGDVAVVLVGNREEQISEISFGADYVNVWWGRRPRRLPVYETRKRADEKQCIENYKLKNEN